MYEAVKASVTGAAGRREIEQTEDDSEHHTDFIQQCMDRLRVLSGQHHYIH